MNSSEPCVKEPRIVWLLIQYLVRNWVTQWCKTISVDHDDARFMWASSLLVENILWPGNKVNEHSDLCVFYIWISLLCFSPCLRIFGGLILDIKRKAPYFWSDFRDAFSLQCLASFLFLYCACMSPVITFGGLLGEATEGRIVCIVLFSELRNLVFKICS